MGDLIAQETEPRTDYVFEQSKERQQKAAVNDATDRLKRVSKRSERRKAIKYSFNLLS